MGNKGTGQNLMGAGMTNVGNQPKQPQTTVLPATQAGGQSLKQLLANAKDTDKIKVIIFATDPTETTTQFVSVGNMGAEFNLGVPISMSARLIKFLSNKDECAIPKYKLDENGKQSHQMIAKYIVQLAEEEE